MSGSSEQDRLGSSRGGSRKLSRSCVASCSTARWSWRGNWRCGGASSSYSLWNRAKRSSFILLNITTTTKLKRGADSGFSQITWDSLEENCAIWEYRFAQADGSGSLYENQRQSKVYEFHDRGKQQTSPADQSRTRTPPPPQLPKEKHPQLAATPHPSPNGAAPCGHPQPDGERGQPEGAAGSQHPAEDRAADAEGGSHPRRFGGRERDLHGQPASNHQPDGLGVSAVLDQSPTILTTLSIYFNPPLLRAHPPQNQRPSRWWVAGAAGEGGRGRRIGINKLVILLRNQIYSNGRHQEGRPARSGSSGERGEEREDGPGVGALPAGPHGGREPRRPQEQILLPDHLQPAQNAARLQLTHPRPPAHPLPQARVQHPSPPRHPHQFPLPELLQPTTPIAHHQEQGKIILVPQGRMDHLRLRLPDKLQPEKWQPVQPDQPPALKLQHPHHLQIARGTEGSLQLRQGLQGSPPQKRNQTHHRGPRSPQIQGKPHTNRNLRVSAEVRLRVRTRPRETEKPRPPEPQQPHQAHHCPQERVITEPPYSGLIIEMFLDKNLQHKYTIGKHLRKLKGLRRRDPTATRIPLPEELREYKEHLEAQGMKIAHMDLGLFQTRNGLTYPGFIATEDIPTNSVLLRVPVDSLLTTRDAFLSEIQKVIEENPKFYAKAFSSDWEDRILLTYLLFEYQKGKESKWYHLIRNLPKEIDYIVFWEEGELELIEDEWVKRSILRERQKVLREQDDLIKIAERYPELFDMKYFTRENIRWIHVHLVTRCFGKYFEYTTMVPYAELFNHECTDVYYTMAYNPDNPFDTKEELDPPKTVTPEEADEVESSDGSYDASDVDADDEDFEEIQPDLKQIPTFPLQTDIRSIESYISAFISFNDGVSLPFLVSTFQEMEDVKINEEDLVNAKRRLEKVHTNNVKYLKLVKEFYQKLGYNTYRYGLRQKKKWKENDKASEQMQVDPKEKYFQGSWKKDKFDQFLMVCSSKDQYEQGAQVYFCYGRLPNRLLLMRYGIALEHNKYNHLFVRIDISEIVYHCNPLLKFVVLDIALKRYRKFKIKRACFCIEILTFHRGLQWQYFEDPEFIFYVCDVAKEMKVLAAVEQILTTKLQSFKCSLTKNEEMLNDKNVGYHEYFAVVYRLEQQRILQEQLNMIQYARQTLTQIESGRTLEQVLGAETDEGNLRYQLMMSDYFGSFKLQHWKKLA